MHYLLKVNGDDPEPSPDINVVATDFGPARSAAVRALRHLIAERLQQGRAISAEWTLQIVDEAGQVLESLSAAAVALEGPRDAHRHRRLYAAVRHPYLFLAPDFGILEANPAYLNATMTQIGAITHRQMFEAFPDNPKDPDASGERNLRDSLNFVLERKVPHIMPLQRYDIRNHDGEWEERYWNPVNFPLLDDNGEVEFIVHHVEDVTYRVLRRVRSISNIAARYVDAAQRCEAQAQSMPDAALQAQMLGVAMQWREMARAELDRK